MRSVDIKFTIIYHIQGEIQTFFGETPILISGYDLNIFEHVCRKDESATFLPATVSVCSVCSWATMVSIKAEQRLARKKPVGIYYLALSIRYNTNCDE